MNLLDDGISDPRNLRIGSFPCKFSEIICGSQSMLFISSDRPAILNLETNIADLVNVDAEDLLVARCFKSDIFPDSLIFLKRDGVLSFGLLEEIRRVHIRKFEFQEMVRKVCVADQNLPVLISTSQSLDLANERCFVKLLDSRSFEGILIF